MQSTLTTFAVSKLWHFLTYIQVAFTTRQITKHHDDGAPRLENNKHVRHPPPHSPNHHVPCPAR